MKVGKIEEVQIPESAIVTVTRMNHLIEVQHMEKKNSVCHIKKLDADRYVDVTTGEIKHFEKSESRADSINSIQQTFKKLRYLINNNFQGKPNELFCTLTYAKQTNDYLQVGKDYDNFLKRLKRKFKDISRVEAVKVLEPHASGYFHMHVLLRFDDVNRIYIDNKEFAEIWGHGYVKLNRLNDVDNIGAYVSAYLSDVEVPLDFEGLKTIEKEINGEKKKFIKGARLKCYPPGVNIFSKTKGIVYPIREEMTYKKAKEKVGATNPHYKKSLQITDEEKDFSNTITYEQYNLKR